VARWTASGAVLEHDGAVKRGFPIQMAEIQACHGVPQHDCRMLGAVVARCMRHIDHGTLLRGASVLQIAMYNAGCTCCHVASCAAAARLPNRPWRARVALWQPRHAMLCPIVHPAACARSGMPSARQASVIAADLNADGQLELLAADSRHNVAVFDR
jgi:hypothetical protein